MKDSFHSTEPATGRVPSELGRGDVGLSRSAYFCLYIRAQRSGGCRAMTSALPIGAAGRVFFAPVIIPPRTPGHKRAIILSIGHSLATTLPADVANHPDHARPERRS